MHTTLHDTDHVFLPANAHATAAAPGRADRDDTSHPTLSSCTRSPREPSPAHQHVTGARTLHAWRHAGFVKHRVNSTRAGSLEATIATRHAATHVTSPLHAASRTGGRSSRAPEPEKTRPPACSSLERTRRSRSPSTAARESSEFVRCRPRTTHPPLEGFADHHGGSLVSARWVTCRKTRVAARQAQPARPLPQFHGRRPDNPYGAAPLPGTASRSPTGAPSTSLRSRTGRFAARRPSSARALSAFASLSAHAGPRRTRLVTACQTTGHGPVGARRLPAQGLPDGIPVSRDRAAHRPTGPRPCALRPPPDRAAETSSSRPRADGTDPCRTGPCALAPRPSRPAQPVPGNGSTALIPPAQRCAGRASPC